MRDTDIQEMLNSAQSKADLCMCQGDQDQRAIDALTALFELHKPADMLGDVVCDECLEYDPSCPSGPAPWPCATVRNVVEAFNR